MLATFQGVVERGGVRWIGTAPPVGTLVVVVARELPSVEDQIARLQAIPPDEWRKSFEPLYRAWDESEPAELEGQRLSEAELQALIEQAREEVYAAQRRD